MQCLAVAVKLYGDEDGAQGAVSKYKGATAHKTVDGDLAAW